MYQLSGRAAFQSRCASSRLMAPEDVSGPLGTDLGVATQPCCEIQPVRVPLRERERSSLPCRGLARFHGHPLGGMET